MQYYLAVLPWNRYSGIHVLRYIHTLVQYEQRSFRIRHLDFLEDIIILQYMGRLSLLYAVDYEIRMSYSDHEKVCSTKFKFRNV